MQNEDIRLTDRARVFSIVLIPLLLGLAFLPRVVHEMGDFEVYWTAGRRALQAEPLYRPEDGHYQLKYLPAFAVLFAPIAILPLGFAKAVWFLASVAVVVALVGMSVTLLPRKRLPATILAALTVVAMLKFYAHELNLGQTNALMALLVVTGFRSVMAGRETQGGLWLAAATIVKPYAVAFLPYLLVKKRLVAFTAFLAALGALLVVPVAFYGFEGTRALMAGWAGTLSASTRPNLTGQDNISVWAMFAKWLGVGPPAFALGFAAACLLGLLALWVVRKAREGEGSEYLEMSLLLILLPLCSPQGWDYVLLVSTPAVALLLNDLNHLPYGVRLVTGAAMVTMAFSVFDLMGRRAYTWFMSLSAITVCALVLVASLACLRFKRTA